MIIQKQNNNTTMLNIWDWRHSGETKKLKKIYLQLLKCLRVFWEEKEHDFLNSMSKTALKDIWKGLRSNVQQRLTFQHA